VCRIESRRTFEPFRAHLYAVHHARTLPREPPGDIKLSATPRNTVDGTRHDAAPQNGEPLAAAAAPVDLSAPEYYLNRELTWLEFNLRVLNEARDPRTPLLERVKFLAIVSGNLDEFFMKRIGGLRNLLLAGHNEPFPDGLTPAEQLVACRDRITAVQRQRETIFADVLSALDAEDIGITPWRNLDAASQRRLREHFIRDVYPLVTPLGMDPGHPFPFISNLALNLLVTMRYPGERERRIARVKVPVTAGVAPRLQQVGQSNRFVLLEDVLANNLDLLFPGMQIDSCSLFRVTRNARLDLRHENADDLLELIESGLEEQPFQPIVRLQVDAGMEESQRTMLMEKLGLEQEDVYTVRGMMGMQSLFEIAGLDMPELKAPPHHPADHPRLAHDGRNMFDIIRDGGPVLVQHPYESFTSSVERFLRTASVDPSVFAIKMTLYRTSAEGNVIQYLIDAARNRKHVAVLVELQARFDEAANIRWARRLEEAGIHVTYGVMGLKTHTKLILVVRRDADGLRRYMHVGTGNYHPGTARLYSDLGLFTCDEQIGADVTELFNYLTGYPSPRQYRKVLVAPDTIKTGLIERIEREVRLHRADSPGRIQFKCNALEDVAVVRALYRAAQAGVKIDLIIRDTCRLRPGIEGLTETVKVISIVGRFLEHARVFYFHNGGDEEYFIGSADIMRRNLDSRVEVIVPVEDEELREQLRLMLNVQLGDSRSAWDMQPDGSYVQRQPSSRRDEQGCQDTLIAITERRASASLKRKEQSLTDRLARQFRRRLRRRFGRDEDTV
jgi:polyphosphate kinase